MQWGRDIKETSVKSRPNKCQLKILLFFKFYAVFQLFELNIELFSTALCMIQLLLVVNSLREPFDVDKNLNCRSHDHYFPVALASG